MILEDYFDFLAPDEIKLKGHRIWLQDVLYEYIHRGMTLEELVERFDTLTREDLLATLLYYHHNKEAVDKYMAEWLDYCREAEKKNLNQHAAWYEKMRRLIEQRAAERRKQAAS